MDNHKRWYVLCAISGKENKVKEYIDAEINSKHFNDRVAQVLIPTEKVVTVRSGKRVVKDRNYLPGYVLVEASMTSEVAHELRSTPNVMGFLGGLSNPTPLRQNEIDHILGNVDEQADLELEQIPFVVGDSVKVVEGPFGGFVGVVEEINPEKKKLTVSVKVFGRSTPLSLSFSQATKE